MAIFYGSSGADTVGTGVVGNAAIADLAVTGGKIANATIAPTKLAQPLTLGTAQASTSGTNIDFTGIPSWVKRITVMFSGVSTNGTSNHLLQIGSGSVEATGYLGAAGTNDGSGVGAANYTTGFGIRYAASTQLVSGHFVLTLLGSNLWVASGNFASSSNTNVCTSAGNKTTAGTLDRVRITTVNGTDTFDAGSINILYE